MEQIYIELIKGFQAMTWLEGIAVVFGVLSVLFSKQNHIGVYPTGIVSTGIYIYLFINAALYAEASLNAYYLVMSLYGWFLWTRKDAQQHERNISRINQRELYIAVTISGLGWLVIWSVLKHFTDSTTPVLDAFVSSTAWAGMWLLAKRKVENWIFLNISNFVAVPLLFYKHLALTGLLTIFLFIIAVMGYFQWLRIYRQSLKTTS
ncbi:nicotinamide riboside transporter PnuC [Chitinophaga horti]|uniref:Nicotinamide riboside transporter PnuC n=1 Tax=Chitinophaga horti TaxID=2920382 RepID=A0ABY6IZQ8_9BACT|nr:nicotinamide riboside transporter PnuC [Chitinophaga horti]UYQ92903.1 nicotinamide riboside transporter PnuC [Chitinophaga horti]